MCPDHRLSGSPSFETQYERCTSAIKLKGCLQRDALFWGGGFRVRGLRCVQRVHVSLMVLRVVQSHDLLRDIRLKRIVRVGERGKSICHFGAVVSGGGGCWKT